MLKQLWKQLWCRHQYRFIYNIHGDEINATNGKRSWWRCETCGKWQARDQLYRGD